MTLALPMDRRSTNVESWMVATSLIFAYLALTLILGLVANRKLTVDMEDFLLYGRRAGFVVLYLTLVSTFYSAFAFLGSSGFFYTHGIGFWAAGSWGIITGALTYVLGPRIWALGKRFGYVTPADMLADFYESEVIRVVVALVSVLFTILHIQVQALGLGYILSTASGGHISFQLGTAILLAVAVAYLIIGGLRAVYWTDVLQGVWMYVAIWVGALVLSYQLFGGPLKLWRRVAVERPDLLTLPGPEGFFTPGMWLGMGVVLTFGVVLQPQMMIRYYTAVSARTIRWLGATIPIYSITLYIPAALIGLGGALVMPELETPDRIFPALLFRYTSPWLTGIVLAGAASAAMSTLDSILHANMTVLTRDIYQRYVRPQASQAHYVWIGRVIALGLVVVAYLLSLYTFDFLVLLVALSGAGALQLMPAVCGVCFPTRSPLTRTGVLTGIGSGLLVLYLTVIVYPHPLSLHGGVWALGVNLALTLAVSRFTRPPRPGTLNRIHGTLEELVYGKKEKTERNN